MTQLMYRIANEAPVDILSVNPNVPGAVAQVISRALTKDLSQRFKSGDEMAQAIRACAAVGTRTVDVLL
jgi:serine/threonine-protein kinase